MLKGMLETSSSTKPALYSWVTATAEAQLDFEFNTGIISNKTKEIFLSHLF